MKFSAFNLKQEVINALNELGYDKLTPVQELVIPKALKNENIVVQSETGTGKTHSFIVPIINNIDFTKTIQAIIITPTRELARQTYTFINEFNKFLPDLSCKLFISGQDQNKDIDSIENGCQIIVSTPGRLNFLKSFLNKTNSNIKTIVLDEADMLIDPGFINDIDEIINNFDEPKLQVFSATINKQVEIFLKKYIGADYTITMSEENYTSNTVKHYFIDTKHKNINDCVVNFIKIVNPFLLMIFTNSQEETRKIYKHLSNLKYKCGILSGELLPRERKSMLRRIKANEFEIICCTDIASRGLDIENVSDVLSLDLPNNLEYYYHRAGRSGRNFKNGSSYVFYDNDHLDKLQKLLDSGLKVQFLKFKNTELTENKNFSIKQNSKNKVINAELNKDIKKAIHEAKSKKIKPNYKKKVKRAVEKVKKKYKKEAIKRNIRKELNNYYKGSKK